MASFLRLLCTVPGRLRPNWENIRNQVICLALASVLLSHFASGQSVQTNALNDRQVPHHPLMSMNVFQETHRAFSGVPNKQRVHANLIGLVVSLRASGAQLPLPTGKFLPNNNERNRRSVRMMPSAQSEIYVIDTAIVKSKYRDTTRHLYTFDARAKKVSDLTQTLAGDYWVDESRETNTYDESSNMLTDLYQFWRDDHWVTYQNNTYTYDAKGNLVSLFIEPFGNMGESADGARWTYTYDANGDLLSDLWQILWDSTSLWENVYCDTYTYDASNNMVTTLTEYWSNGQWLNEWRATYIYDATNNLLSYSTDTWSNGLWLNEWRATYTYDASNNILSLMYENWLNSQWVFDNRFTYSYDANENLLSCLCEYWLNGQWLNFSRATYTYDSSYDVLSDLYEEWSSGQWMNRSKKIYNYDAQGNLASFWNYTWLNASWTPADIGGRAAGLIVTDSAGNSYGYIGYNFEFSHRLMVTGVASNITNLPANYSLFQNYPNPFNPSTVIGYSVGGVRGQVLGVSEVRLVVYDLVGREVAILVNERKAPGSYQVKFDGSGLSTGVYMYRLTTGSFVQSRKMLLIK
jgi:hypothetical protein